MALVLVAASSTWMTAATAEEPIRTALLANDGGEPFDDMQRDAVLIGVRITVDQSWDRWDVVYSIQPIFRQQSGEIVRGDIHGADRGLELVSEAKPGYVVGRIEVAKGGMIDGMHAFCARARREVAARG